MKIFYIGDIRGGATSLDRMKALERIGNTVVPFNVPPYESTIRIVSSIQCRLHPRFLLQKLNDDIRQYANKVGDFQCAWIDKGVWIFPETIAYLKKKCGFVIHYTPDPQLLFHRSRHFVQSIRIYDHIVTTKDFEVPLYKNAGANNVILVTQSYCPKRYENPLPSAQFVSDVGFVGRCESHYLQSVNRVSEVANIAVFGDQWLKSSHKKVLAPKISANRSVWREDYVSALASFKVGFGLLSKLIPEQHTTRTFEIPAAGTFLLAERTDEHQSFFQEGVEAEFFDSVDELHSKLKFYLQHDPARERIAKKGRLRCESSGYDTDSTMKKILRHAT